MIIDSKTVRQEYDISSELIKDFMCNNTEMKFLSNPGDKETGYNLDCTLFEADNLAYLHLHFDSGTISEETLSINRTDNSYQYFDVEFGSNLEFMEILISKMYFREQSSQSEDVFIPHISN